MSRELLPLRCFGKLPLDGGFLEVGVPSPAFESLRVWIRGGHVEVVRRRGAESRTTPLESRAARILFVPAPGEDLAAAVLRPTRDAEGRPHVFAAFIELPYRRFGGRFHTFLPAALAACWDALDGAWDALSCAPSRAIFNQLIEEHRIPEPEDPREIRTLLGRSRTEREKRFLDGQGAPDGDERRARIKELARRITSGREGLRALEVPVADDLAEASFDASFWIDCLSSQLLLRRLEPSVFISTAPAHESRRAVLVFQPLHERDYAALMVGESMGERFLNPHVVQGAAHGRETDSR